jgi:hypothetical protein
MASAATAPSVKTRCKRCATILRNSRKICPCCNLDVNAPEVDQAQAEVAKTPAEEPGQKKPRAATAKTGVKICPICMATVPEAEMIDHQGKRVCPACAQRVQKLPGSGGGVGGAPAPTPMSSPAPARVGGGSGMNASIATAAATETPRTSAHVVEQLKKRLLWPKIILILFGVIFACLGGLTMAGGSLLGMGADMMNVEELQAELEKDPQFKKLSFEEKQARLDQMQQAKDKVGDAAFKVKLMGIGLVLVAVFFIGTFFMMEKYPFEACLIALIVFILDKVVGIFTGSIPGVIGIFVIISITSALINGVMAGQRLKSIRAEKGRT